MKLAQYVVVENAAKAAVSWEVDKAAIMVGEASTHARKKIRFGVRIEEAGYRVHNNIFGADWNAPKIFWYFR